MKIFLSKTLRIIVIKLSKIWVWDPNPRSGIGDPETKPIPDPRSSVKKAPDPGSGSATLNANHHDDIINDLNGLRLNPQKFITRRKNLKILWRSLLFHKG
jgi:hypothetical protein